MCQCPNLLVHLKLLCRKVGKQEGWRGVELGFANDMFSDKLPTGV